jgi:hypothetical protein
MAFGLHFTSSIKKTIPVVPKTVKKPIFANNAMVLYKAGSLAPGGIGTVRNSRRKAKFT